MCRPKEDGGRRCTSSTPEYRRAKRLEKRTLAEEAVESPAVTAVVDAHTGDTTVDLDALALSWREHAETHPTPTPAYLKNGEHWSNQRMVRADGSEYTQTWEATTKGSDWDKYWPTVAEATIVEPDTSGYREMGGHKVGVLYQPATEEWLAYDAKQDERGMWDVRGVVADDLAHSASHLAPEHPEALGMPAHPVVRPDADALIEMFPPHRDAVKAAWAHDPEYVEQVEAAEFLAAMGPQGKDWQRMRTSLGGVRGEWVNHSGHNATPLMGKMFTEHFGAYGHNQMTVTDDAGNPVEWDNEAVTWWVHDADAEPGEDLGWRPVAMVKPKQTSLERRKKGTRTFYRPQRHNAYGIARNDTTGQWAVYSTTDTSTSADWKHGRDGYAWDTRVVVSTDINKAAAHLTVQQREALGLPCNPDSHPAVGDTYTADTRKVA